MTNQLPDPGKDANINGLDSNQVDSAANGSSVPRQANAMPKQQGEQAFEPDQVDVRMADLLSNCSDNRELRRQLQGEQTEEASDLLSRLNALDFVQQVVGGHSELPDSIGGYAIKGLLGRGGMGIVYLGWQHDLEREVALKVLSSNYNADPTMRKRFRAEARATAALHHRHIVPIYDYGESHGMLFFAMERVNGLSLDKHISSGRRIGKKPLEVLEAARRFAGVADALGLAHRRRLLHRDVKPGNILVGDDGTLALTDFGLAKALDHVSMHLTSKGGGFLGTLHYASPEQALGGELTSASDLYSLGVTMFEAVTGELPLAGKSTEALLQSIRYGTPSRLRDHLPKPSRDFEAVLDKLLARDPDDRYQDGEALSRDLLRIADGEPVHIRRLPFHVRLWRRARKNPVLTSALLAVFILIVSTGALAGVLNTERGKGRISQYQNDLVQIAKDVGQELGPAFGPIPLLESLTGVVVSPSDPSMQILESLTAAQNAMPTDTQADDMLRAYIEDPLLSASSYLRVGRGYEAQQLYDIAIAKANLAHTSGELAVELRMYRLYLARGIAKLTQSVARVSEARVDLALASYLRPEAAFPLAVMDVLDLVQSSDVEAKAAALKKKLVDTKASPELVRTVGLLLWAAAAHAPHPKSNLMSFPLAFSSRSILHALAVELLEGRLPEQTLHGQPCGLAADFATECRSALAKLSDPAALRSSVKVLDDAIQRSAHAESRLQGWRHLLQLLVDPRQRGLLLDDDNRPLPAAMQLAAWSALISLKPREALVKLWLNRFKEFHSLHPGLPGIAQVAAQIHLLAGSEDAFFWADRWCLDSEGDPSALMCRMEILLQLERVPEARDDATVAVQNSLDANATLLQILKVLGSIDQGVDGLADDSVRMMDSDFRMLMTSEQIDFGGR